MEYSSYSEETFEKFIINNVCQDDKTLIRYLKENNQSACEYFAWYNRGNRNPSIEWNRHA